MKVGNLINELEAMMCFYAEADWHASIIEDKERTPIIEVRCDECRRIIKAGDFIRTIYMQEHEECQACEAEECDCPDRLSPDPHDCQCDAPQFGETFDYDRCEECDKFLKAVKAAEIEEGCSGNEVLPPLPEMISCIQQVGRREAARYFRKALRCFPELKASGYLGWLWRRMFYS